MEKNLEAGAPASGPLAGIKVLDLTAILLGPVATQILGDYGADVIKIEQPGGDPMRKNGVVRHEGLGSIFIAANRNKRSVMLDLKTPEGADALRALIATADVFVHNMRIAAIERLGFGYEAVAAINPAIVYCAATGYGQDGPFRKKPAFDDAIQAGCGMVGMNTPPGRTPDFVRSAIADKVTGIVLANAVMAALVHRVRTGAGQFVEVPMLETMTAFVLTEHMGGLAFEGASEPAGYQRMLGGRHPIPTRDGWLCLLPYGPDNWRSLLQACGQGEAAERLNLDSLQQVLAHRDRLYTLLEDAGPTMSTAQWMALCDSLDIPAADVYRLDDLPSHPHLAAVGLFQDSEHPVAGRIREVRPTVRFSATPAALRMPAPALGQHTDEVLREAGVAPIPRA